MLLYTFVSFLYYLSSLMLYLLYECRFLLMYNKTMTQEYQTESHLQYLLLYHQRTAHNDVYHITKKSNIILNNNNYSWLKINIYVNLISHWFGPLAQRLEQGTHNPLVLGSNPRWPNKIQRMLDFIFLNKLPIAKR